MNPGEKKMQKRKTILITGSTGFIGKNLAEFLEGKKEYDLLRPSHSQLELLDPEKVSEFVEGNSIDVIVHCAAVGGTRKTAYDKGKTDVVAKNLRMFFNIARCLGKARMVHLGSGAEYGREHCKPRVKEEFFDAHVPEDAYGFSKYVCSKYIEKADNLVCLRPFGVFGRYEDYSFKFISNAIV